MRGLILKDLLVNRKYIVTSGIVSLFYFAYGAFLQNELLFAFLAVLLSLIFIISTFACDEAANWEGYALTMPISIKCIVISKYVLTALTILTTSIATFLFAVVYSSVLRHPMSKEFIMVLLTGGLLGIIFLSVEIPLIAKFGSEKARYVLMAVILIPSLLIAGISKMGTSFSYVAHLLSSIETYLPYILILFSIIAVCLSILITFNIYRKKEYN